MKMHKSRRFLQFLALLALVFFFINLRSRKMHTEEVSAYDEFPMKSDKNNLKLIEDCKLKNPEWEHRLWDFDQVTSLVKHEFSHVMHTFELLDQDEQFFVSRFFILRNFGGVFLNNDSGLLRKIKQRTEAVVGGYRLKLFLAVRTPGVATTRLPWARATSLKAPPITFFQNRSARYHKRGAGHGRFDGRGCGAGLRKWGQSKA